MYGFCGFSRCASTLMRPHRPGHWRKSWKVRRSLSSLVKKLWWTWNLNFQLVWPQSSFPLCHRADREDGGVCASYTWSSSSSCFCFSSSSFSSPSHLCKFSWGYVGISITQPYLFYCCNTAVVPEPSDIHISFWLHAECSSSPSLCDQTKPRLVV